MTAFQQAVTTAIHILIEAMESVDTCNVIETNDLELNGKKYKLYFERLKQ